MTAHTSGRLEAPGPESAACPGHEAPELLHLHDPLDGEAYGLGVRAGAKDLPRPIDSPHVHEEGLARVTRGPGRSLPHRHMLNPIQAYCKNLLQSSRLRPRARLRGDRGRARAAPR